LIGGIVISSLGAVSVYAKNTVSAFNYTYKGKRYVVKDKLNADFNVFSADSATASTWYATNTQAKNRKLGVELWFTKEDDRNYRSLAKKKSKNNEKVSVSDRITGVEWFASDHILYKADGNRIEKKHVLKDD